MKITPLRKTTQIFSLLLLSGFIIDYTMQIDRDRTFSHTIITVCM